MSREQQDAAAAESYLRELWPDGIPEASGLVVCRNVADGTRVEDLEAAMLKIRAGNCQFIRSTLALPSASGRGGAALATASPGIHAEIDLKGGLHKAENLPTLGEALAFLAPLPLPPTLVLSTGGGLLVWWLYREPWVFDGLAERQRDELLLKGWQGFVQDLAAGRGWHVDGTATHAQLVRIEGTLNRKYDPPRLVKRISDGGPRWNPSDFDWGVTTGRGYRGGGPHTNGRNATPADCAHLPREIPRDLRDLIDRLSLSYRVKRDDAERVCAILLATCPACGGREKRGSVVLESAHLGPLSGALRCKRETCEARESGGGIPLWTWVARWAPEGLPFAGKDAVLFPPETWRVVFEEAAEELASLIAVATDWVRRYDGIAVVAAPVGIGKSTATLESMRREPHVVYFGRNYRELEEKMRDLGAPATLREGITRACVAAGIQMASRSGVVRGWRGTACRGCGYRETCGVWRPIAPDVPLFAPHDADEQLSHDGKSDGPGMHDREDPNGDAAAIEGRVAFYDECPPVLRTCHLTPADLARVETAPIRAARDSECSETLRRQRAAAIYLARTLLDLLRAVEVEAAEVAERDSSRARHLAYEQEEILELVGRSGSAPEDTQPKEPLRLENLRLGAQLDDGFFAVPSAEQRRDGSWLEDEFHPGYAHDETVSVLRSFAVLCLLPTQDLLRQVEFHSGRLRIALDARYRPRVELRVPRPLAAPKGAVVLDATGFLELDALRRANPDRPVRFFGLDVAPAEGAELHLLWIATRSAARRSVLRAGRPTPRGATFLERTLQIAGQRAAETFGRAATTGLISYKPVREAVDAALAGEGRATQALSACGQNLRFARERLGHYGLDERGSNAFQDVEVLITWGDPRKNVGAAGAEGRALHLPDPRARADAQTHTTLAQAVGRARAVRGGKKLLVHVGSVCPAGWRGHCEVVPLEVGRPARDEREEYQEFCRHLLAGPGWASVWAVDAKIAAEWASEGVGRNCSINGFKSNFGRPPSDPADAFGAPRTRRNWVEHAGRQFSAVRVRVPLPCRTVWARPDVDEAEVRRQATELWWRLNPASAGDTGWMEADGQWVNVRTGEIRDEPGQDAGDEEGRLSA